MRVISKFLILSAMIGMGSYAYAAADSCQDDVKRINRDLMPGRVQNCANDVKSLSFESSHINACVGKCAYVQGGFGVCQWKPTDINSLHCIGTSRR